MKVSLKRNLGRQTCVALGLAEEKEWHPEEFLSGNVLELDGKPLESLLVQKLAEEVKGKTVTGESKEPALKAAKVSEPITK